MMPSQGEKFDFSDLLNMACVPVYKILEAHTNPFLVNKQVMCVGDKLWNGILDGTISQIPTYDQMTTQKSALDDLKPKPTGSLTSNSTLIKPKKSGTSAFPPLPDGSSSAALKGSIQESTK